MQWQTLSLSPYDQNFSATHPFVIKIYIAEQTQPLIVTLYQHHDDYLLQTDLHLLLLKSEQLPLLLEM
ncbi:MAG TPA: hypothetical protein EYH12_06900 [Psychromonas hadalis]|nr:hypothetical protein [Psychromonas hadalis]